ncbi:MAG: hypothetical protein HP497_04950 [Nitrospira sp.]|nr:hypothetical protein [Nitrospira sp.]
MSQGEDDEIDRLAENYGQVLETQRRELGLDEFIKIVPLSCDQQHLVEDILLIPDPQGIENRSKIRELLVPILTTFHSLRNIIATLNNNEVQKQRERRSNRVLAVLPLVISVAMIATLTFRHAEITVYTDDDSVFLIESSWWGLEKKHREIKWMESEDDGSGWMVRDEDGSWRLYLIDRDFFSEHGR